LTLSVRVDGLQKEGHNRISSIDDGVDNNNNGNRQITKEVKYLLKLKL